MHASDFKFETLFDLRDHQFITIARESIGPLPSCFTAEGKESGERARGRSPPPPDRRPPTDDRRFSPREQLSPTAQIERRKERTVSKLYFKLMFCAKVLNRIEMKTSSMNLVI